jgi:uncharacterized iron-regulated membrane protein
MKSLTALSLSIAVLGGVATFLALGVVSGYVLIWGIFIGWGAFFALGATGSHEKCDRLRDFRRNYGLVVSNCYR